MVSRMMRSPQCRRVPCVARWFTSGASERARTLASFKVMDVLRAANALEASGRRVHHLEVGQPQTGAPPSAVQAAQGALAAGLPLGYTAALGDEGLRRRIAAWYAETGQGVVDPSRVVVTTGSSAGFVLGFSALFNPGDRVGVPSVAYPCYRNVLRALGCVPVPLGAGDAADPRDGFALPDAATIRAAAAACGDPPIKGLVLSSPANPTGATLDGVALEALAAECARLGIAFVSDEIYHHISYDGAPPPRSAVGLDGALVVNSFSKFFSMTGWRVGWLVLPREDPELAGAVERLQQNLFINAPTISQVAAEAAFDDSPTALAENVARYARNRETVLAGLRDVGFDAHVASPDGAFYVYCDLRHLGITDTPAWCVAASEIKVVSQICMRCARLLEDTGVALTPGVDFEFDPAVGKCRVRFSYCGASDDITEAMEKLKVWVLANPPSDQPKE